MELSDDFETEMKKVEAEIHKTELDNQVQNLGQEINKAGHELSAGIRKTQDSALEKNTLSPGTLPVAGAGSPADRESS